MSNRREPVTKDMVVYLIDKGATKYSNNHVAVTADWLILGLRASFRKAEWAQDRTHVNMNGTYKYNINGSSSTLSTRISSSAVIKVNVWTTQNTS